MEKAILKTLIYADIFDYPLKVWEIHKWLIRQKVTLRQVEKAVGRLVQSAIPRLRSGQTCKVQSGYYFLPKRVGLVRKRQIREKQSEIYFKKAKFITYFLKVIPWIKLVGVSGGLALNNASKKDDIDLFIITSKKRLWLSRLMVLGLLSLTGQRRKVGDLGQKIAGKFCINTLLEEDKLEQSSKDIYLAHEVLQMKVLWERGGMYRKHLLDNNWAFKFLPNWVGHDKDLGFKIYDLGKKNRKSLFANRKSILDYIENLAKRFQLWYMQKPKGMERIQNGALYFHPNDIRTKVLQEYQRKISHIIGTP